MKRSGTSSAVVLIAAFAVVATACGGSGDAADNDDGPVVAQDDDASSGDDTDDAAGEQLQIWADELLIAVADLETAQRDIALEAEPMDASAPDALALLAEQAGLLGALGSALPDDPPSGELLTSRYRTFVAAHGELVAASDDVTTKPDPDLPWAFGEATAHFAERRDRWLESCFALQETLADDDLGVLGCVGLTGAEDAAAEVFDSMLTEAWTVLSFVIPDDLGIDAELTVAPRTPQVFFNRYSCQPEAEVPQLDRIDDFVAAAGTLHIADDQGETSVEVWAFADATSARAVADIIYRLVKTQKLCIAIDDALVSHGAEIDEDEELVDLTLGTGQGYTVTLYPNDREPLHYQLAVASQGNVVSLFARGGNGAPWDERVITEIIGAAVISGSRQG